MTAEIQWPIALISNDLYERSGAKGILTVVERQMRAAIDRKQGFTTDPEKWRYEEVHFPEGCGDDNHNKQGDEDTTDHWHRTYMYAEPELLTNRT